MMRDLAGDKDDDKNFMSKIEKMIKDLLGTKEGDLE
jgi:hypothetical protein